jgi:tetratricopeptide (TPR) repeat protein
LEPVIAERVVTPATDPDVFAALARSYIASGSGHAALELFKTCLDELRAAKADNSSAYLRLATYLSYARANLGDVEGARAALDDALAHADTFSDPERRIRAYWSQARLAAAHGDHASARKSIGRAIALLEQAEDAMQVARAQLVYAESLIADDQFEEAASRVAGAEATLGAHARPRDQAWVALLWGKILNLRGDHLAAAESARAAIELGGDDDPELRGRAEAVLGEAFWRGGDEAAALAAFERADSLLAGGEPRFVREILYRWSEVLEAAGRLPDALKVLRRVAVAVPPAAHSGGSTRAMGRRAAEAS